MLFRKIHVEFLFLHVEIPDSAVPGPRETAPRTELRLCLQDVQIPSLVPPGPPESHQDPPLKLGSSVLSVAPSWKHSHNTHHCTLWEMLWSPSYIFKRKRRKCLLVTRVPSCLFGVTQRNGRASSDLHWKHKPAGEPWGACSPPGHLLPPVSESLLAVLPRARQILAGIRWSRVRATAHFSAGCRMPAWGPPEASERAAQTNFPPSSWCLWVVPFP